MVPGSLDELHGPTTDEVTLPNGLCGTLAPLPSGQREVSTFDVRDRYLREAEHGRPRAFLNHGLLIEHWATLSLLRYIAA